MNDTRDGCLGAPQGPQESLLMLLGAPQGPQETLLMLLGGVRSQGHP